MRRSIRRAPSPTRRGSTSRIRSIRWSHTTFGKSIAAAARNVRALDAPLRQAGLGHRRDTVVGGERVAGRISRRSGSGRSAGCCISSACSSTRRAGRSRKRADRRADVGPLRDAAARHRRGLPARTTTSTSPTGSMRAWCRWRRAASISTTTSTTSSRILHALGGDCHVIAVCQPSVPVLAAVALHGSRRRSVRAAFDDPDGRADRHARQPDRRSTSSPRSAASTGSAATSSPRCRSRIRA